MKKKKKTDMKKSVTDQRQLDNKSKQLQTQIHSQ